MDRENDGEYVGGGGGCSEDGRTIEGGKGL